MFVCLFVSYKSISQKRKICISTFFSKKGNINFYHLSYWILLSYLQLVIVVNNGFWPGRREGRGAGGYTRGQQVGVGVSPSIRARAKVVRQHWQGKSIQICSFFRRIMGVAIASGLTRWAEWASGLSHAPSKLWRHCAMQRYQRPFLFFFFWFSFFFNQRILPIYVA